MQVMLKNGELIDKNIDGGICLVRDVDSSALWEVGYIMDNIFNVLFVGSLEDCIEGLLFMLKL